MVVDRRHAKDPPTGAFEPEDLDDDRQRFDYEQAANNRKNEFMMRDDSNGSQGTAERKTARVPHEHSGGRRVEPEKGEPGSYDSAT
jgi:hypothetical protein